MYTHRKWWWRCCVAKATIQCNAFKMSICVAYVWTGFDTYDAYTHATRLCNLIDHNIDQAYMKNIAGYGHICIILCVLAHAELCRHYSTLINAFRFVLIGIIVVDKIELLSPTNCQFNKWVHITRIMLVDCKNIQRTAKHIFYATVSHYEYVEQ